MGAGDLNMSGFNADAARYDRENRLNPPDFAPGQEGGGGLFDSSSSIFPSSSSPANTGGMGDIFSSGVSSPMSGGLGGLGMGGMGGLGGDSFSPFNASPIGMNSMTSPTMQQPQQPKDASDQFWDALGKGFKGIKSFVNEFSKSFNGLTPLFWAKYGKNNFKIGLILGILGVILRIFGVGIGLKVAIGAILSSAVGCMLLMFNTEKARQYTSQYVEDNNTDQNFNNPSQVQPQPVDGFNDFGGGFNNSDFGSGFDDAMVEDDNFGDSDFGDEEDDPYGLEDDDDWGDIEVDTEPSFQEGMSVEDALNSFVEIDKGMYTRKYLYDTFIKVLPNLKSDFASVTTYSDDDETFLFWDDIIQRAARITGFRDEDDLPYLKSLEENLFTIRATITRSSKLKPELLAAEVANAYAFQTYEDDDEKRASVFAKVDSVLDDCIITIFLGASHMVSLKDMYAKCEDFITDNKRLMPVVLGISEKGKVITLDFKKVESIIIAGMPRSGKSWLVQALLCQLCALMSPRDLNIFVLDPKGSTSDFKRFTLPHVKKFASKYTSSTGTVVNPDSVSIMDTLRYVVDVEAPRRKKLIGENGFVNINDFRNKFPDVSLPYLYIVVDEMVTLSKMQKEDEVEYQSYLDMIVTQFPNLGIRGIFIPHEVKNQIISKTAYDSIKARISVKGNSSHIDSSTGTKEKDFKYKLSNVGDMAVNIDEISSSTIFVHGVALTDSNEKNNDVFDYLRRIWGKLEPDEISNSVAEQAEIDFQNNKLIEQADNDTNLDDIDLFDDTPSGDVFSESNDIGLSGMNDDFDLF